MNKFFNCIEYSTLRLLIYLFFPYTVVRILALNNVSFLIFVPKSDSDLGCIRYLDYPIFCITGLVILFTIGKMLYNSLKNEVST